MEKIEAYSGYIQSEKSSKTNSRRSSLGFNFNLTDDIKVPSFLQANTPQKLAPSQPESPQFNDEKSFNFDSKFQGINAPSSSQAGSNYSSYRPSIVFDLGKPKLRAKSPEDST